MWFGKGWTMVTLGCRFSECPSPPSLTKCMKWRAPCLQWGWVSTTLGWSKQTESPGRFSLLLSVRWSIPLPSWQQAEKGEKDETQINSFPTWDCLDLLSAPLTSAPAENPFNNILPQIPFLFLISLPSYVQFFYCPLPNSTCSPDTNANT